MPRHTLFKHCSICTVHRCCIDVIGTSEPQCGRQWGRLASGGQLHSNGGSLVASHRACASSETESEAGDIMEQQLEEMNKQLNSVTDPTGFLRMVRHNNLLHRYGWRSALNTRCSLQHVSLCSFRGTWNWGLSGSCRSKPGASPRYQQFKQRQGRLSTFLFFIWWSPGMLTCHAKSKLPAHPQEEIE